MTKATIRPIKSLLLFSVVDSVKTKYLSDAIKREFLFLRMIEKRFAFRCIVQSGKYFLARASYNVRKY